MRSLLAFAGATAIATFLAITAGGLGDFVVYLVNFLRGLNRGVVLIHFVAAIVFSVALVTIAREAKRRIDPGSQTRQLAIWFAPVAAGMLGLTISLSDQVRSPDPAFREAAISTYGEDKAFFDEVGALMRPGERNLLHLPYQAFPEFWGPNGMTTYESLKPYVLLRESKTSAGAFPGTPSALNTLQLQALFRAGEFERLSRALEDDGFDGIVFNLNGLYASERMRMDEMLLQAAGVGADGTNPRFAFVKTAGHSFTDTPSRTRRTPLPPEICLRLTDRSA